MVYTYKKVLEKYGTHYKLIRAIKSGKIIKLNRGMYASSSDYSDFDYIVTKYHKTVFTMDSAFYLLGLTKAIPNKYYLATKRTALRMKEDNIVQYYQVNNIYNIGIVNIKINNLTVKVYDKERMLIELIRNKNRLNQDYFNEILDNYKKIKNNLNIKKINKYLKAFNTKKYILDIINKNLDLNLVI